jgi:hypothetical protein
LPTHKGYCPYSEALYLNFVAGEIEVDEMVEIFCLMYSIQVATQTHLFLFNNIHNISMLIFRVILRKKLLKER